MRCIRQLIAKGKHLTILSCKIEEFKLFNLNAHGVWCIFLLPGDTSRKQNNLHLSSLILRDRIKCCDFVWLLFLANYYSISKRYIYIYKTCVYLHSSDDLFWEIKMMWAIFLVCALSVQLHSMRWVLQMWFSSAKTGHAVRDGQTCTWQSKRQAECAHRSKFLYGCFS